MSKTLVSLTGMLEKVTVTSLSNQHPPRVTNHLSLPHTMSVLALEVLSLGTLPLPGKLEQSCTLIPTHGSAVGVWK